MGSGELAAVYFSGYAGTTNPQKGTYCSPKPIQPKPQI